MEHPHGDAVLSIAPNAKGGWEVLYATNDGVQLESFSSKEAADAFVRKAALLPIPERLAQRQNTLKAQTKRLEKDRISHSRATRLSLISLAAFSSLVALATLLAALYFGQRGEMNWTLAATIAATTVAVIGANASIFRRSRRRRRDERLGQASTAEDWATRAWAAASLDIQIEAPRAQGKRAAATKEKNKPKDNA